MAPKITRKKLIEGLLDDKAAFRNALLSFRPPLTSDLTLTQCELIRVVMARPQGIAAGDLASMLNISRSAVTQHLEDLEAKKFIVRRPSEDDRRSVIVEMTKGGRTKANLIVKERETQFAELLRELSDNELQSFAHIIRKLTQSVHDRKSKSK